MEVPKRSLRRHHLDRIKARMRWYISNWSKSSVHLAQDAEFVGRMASTHGRPCSCYGCKRGERDDILVEGIDA